MSDDSITVEIGDTEVEIAETEDGFEVTEVDEPDRVAVFESRKGSELTIDFDADFEVTRAERHPDEAVVGANEEAVLEGYGLNDTADHALDGEWDGDWYFVEMRVEER